MNPTTDSMTPLTMTAPNPTRARLLAFWERYGVWLAVVVAAVILFKFTALGEALSIVNFSSKPSDGESVFYQYGWYTAVVIGTIISFGVLTGFSYVYYRLIHKPLLGKNRLPYTLLFVCCFLLMWFLIGQELTTAIVRHRTIRIKFDFKTIQDQTKTGVAVTTIIIAIYSLMMGFWLDRRRNQREQKALVQQRTSAQLDALKAQVNPHFLFNSLNNIFGTAMQESAPRTAESVEQLATIMRYVLTESQSQTTPVERELRFLDDYIQLHKLRLPTLDHIQITTDLYWDEQPAEIVPLLLNPLIENAFKYGISIQHPCFVRISLRVEAGVLTLDTRQRAAPA
jgi:hypothetical protein